MNNNDYEWIFTVLHIYLQNIYIWATNWLPPFPLHKATLIRIFSTVLHTASARILSAFPTIINFSGAISLGYFS